MTLKHVLKHFNKTELQDDERFSLAPMREREELLCERSELSNSGEGCKDLPSPDRHPLPRKWNKVSCAEHTVKDLSSNRPIVLMTFKKAAFTLAEVLITLGIIGVVAAITLPSVITKINNKVYAERLIKTYSLLQNATNKIIEEQGAPSNWSWSSVYDSDNTGNDNIIESYKKKLKFVYYCEGGLGYDECKDMYTIRYIGLDNKPAPSVYRMGSVPAGDILGDYQVVLTDAVTVGFRFISYPGTVFWGMPGALGFTVDVNGKKKPNQLGRDIFYLYLDESTGKVLPFINDESTHKLANSCEVGKSGASCAYRVITEGKMNY